MAAVLELPYDLQQFELRNRVDFHQSNGWGAAKYLTPNFLSYFPLAMASADSLEEVSWNEVSGLFRRRDAIPVTFIDDERLVTETKLSVFRQEELFGVRRAPGARAVQAGD